MHDANFRPVLVVEAAVEAVELDPPQAAIETDASNATTTAVLALMPVVVLLGSGCDATIVEPGVEPPAFGT
jgi:hypothetical protein